LKIPTWKFLDSLVRSVHTFFLCRGMRIFPRFFSDCKLKTCGKWTLCLIKGNDNLLANHFCIYGGKWPYSFYLFEIIISMIRAYTFSIRPNYVLIYYRNFDCFCFLVIAQNVQRSHLLTQCAFSVALLLLIRKFIIYNFRLKSTIIAMACGTDLVAMACLPFCN